MHTFTFMYIRSIFTCKFTCIHLLRNITIIVFIAEHPRALSCYWSVTILGGASKGLVAAAPWELVFGMLVQGFESGSGAAVSTESRQGQRCQDKWGQYLGMKIELLLNVWPKARIKKLDEGSSAAPSVHLHQSGKWWKSWVDRVRYSRKRDCALALSDGTIWVGISWPAADGIRGSKHEVGATASLHHAVGRKDFGAAIWHSRSFFYNWII